MSHEPHPLESVFGIEPNTTFIEERSSQIVNDRSSTLVDFTTGDVIPRKVDDITDTDLEIEDRLEDLHIDGQLENLHEVAMNAFQQQSRLAQEVDPKFSARNAEVAAQYLNIALNTVNTRIDSKFKRNKIKIAKKEATVTKNVNNNIIVADRNSILKMMLDSSSTPESSPLIDIVSTESSKV